MERVGSESVSSFCFFKQSISDVPAQNHLRDLAIVDSRVPLQNYQIQGATLGAEPLPSL